MAQPRSHFIDIFMAMRQRITEATDASIYIDQDLGQLRGQQRPPVSWPCILIDFEDFRFENLGENIQTAKGTVVLQLGFAPYSNSTQATPDEYVEQAMAYYNYEMALHKLLHGWSPTDMSGALIRTSVVTQKRNDHYRVRELRYSLAFEDYQAKWEKQQLPVELVLINEISVDR